MTRNARRSGCRTTRPDPAKVGPLLRQAGFRGSDDDPVRVRATYDDQGRPRRVHAHFADGWSCVLYLASDGAYTLRQSLRIRVSGRRLLEREIAL